MELTSEDRQKLKKNPAQYITKTIKEYAAASPVNRLPDFNNEPIIAEPLVGFADGFDPIFREFKKKEIIGDFHLTPEGALAAYLERQQKKALDGRPAAISVISLAFTPSKETRRSNPAGGKMASLRWGRGYGQAFRLMSETLVHVVSLLEASGYRAVAPVCTRPMSIQISPEGLPYTDWSEKHAAYAAGLGTFGLHTSLITASGVPLHLGSVITDLALKPTPRKYDSHLAYCLHYRQDSCERCAQHCPSGAVNTQVFDGKKCMAYAREKLPDLDRALHGEPKPGSHPMCALCQIRLPCEAGIPRGS